MPSISITRQRHILDMIQSAAQNSVKREDFANGPEGDASFSSEFTHHRHLLCMGVWLALGEATPPAWQINIASARTDRMFERAREASVRTSGPQAPRNVLGTAPKKHQFQYLDVAPDYCTVCGKSRVHSNHQ